MPISRERFEEFSLEIAEELPCCMNLPFDAGVVWSKQEITNFAHALLNRVEAECEVVCTRFQHEDTGRNTSLDNKQDAEQFCINNPRWFECGKLIALPLVEGD